MRLIERHRDLVDKFLEIAERKVSTLDDYGEENWDALPREIDTCLSKIAKRQGIDLDRIRHITKASRFGHGVSDAATRVWWGDETFRRAHDHLNKTFRALHEAGKAGAQDEEPDGLAGVEFENYIAKILHSNGYDVRGTPVTGDQGADLIATKNGKKVVIQAKGYQGVVGNKAVQEVMAAVQFYGADEGWVVTNSTFTASAKALAQSGKIRLIDRGGLRNTKEL
ncbi:MAG TPA: restriction endonuclease [Candidatus Acidoferrum sp.]|nr:restriction endonuclease [Candidatus Acidoferrum sp.]